MHMLYDSEAFAVVHILANATVEGEATAHYIRESSKVFGVKVSRIAHGVPLGGELETVDSHTLARALNQRQRYA